MMELSRLAKLIDQGIDRCRKAHGPGDKFRTVDPECLRVLIETITAITDDIMKRQSNSVALRSAVELAVQRLITHCIAIDLEGSERWLARLKKERQIGSN